MSTGSNERSEKAFNDSRINRKIAAEAIYWKKICKGTGDDIDMKDALLISALTNIAELIKEVDISIGQIDIS